MGRSIANAATEETNVPSEAKQAAWALAKVANVMQTASEKQMEKMVEMHVHKNVGSSREKLPCSY